MPINWDGLQTPNFAGMALQGYQQGEKMRLDQTRRNALAKYKDNPDASIGELMESGDLETALALRKSRREDTQDAARTKAAGQFAKGDVRGSQETAIGAGDFDMASTITKLTKEQRETAKAQAEDLGGFAQSLKGLPYEQRRARIEASKAGLIERGFGEEHVDGFDPTDEALDGLIGSAMDLKTALEQQNRDRDFGLRKDQFGETKRHNRRAEGTADRNASTSAYSAQTGRLSFEERKKQKGFGTPGVGGPVADDDVEIDP